MAEKPLMCPILTAGLIANKGIPENNFVSLLCRKEDCEIFNGTCCGLKGEVEEEDE